MSQNAFPIPNFTVRIQCLLPSTSSDATSLIVTPDKRNSVRMTTTRSLAPNSLGYTSSAPEATCNICNRLLYSFEEVLRCRVCSGADHWRCVKPQRVSRYGQNNDYVCRNCNGSVATITSHRESNGNTMNDSLDGNDRDPENRTSITDSTETDPDVTIRPFEDKQQSQPSNTRQVTELDDYLPTQTNEEEYHRPNSQYNDDSRTNQRIQQQENGIGSSDDDENERSSMFQANYRYTPLKDYAAMRTNRTNSEQNTNNYSNSPTDDFDYQPTSRYGGGLHYTDHGYDPTVTRLVEVPSISSTNLTTSTANNLPTNPRQTHFTSTTNLNVIEKPAHRQSQQSNSLVHSTSYLSSTRQSDPLVLRSLSQQQTDRHSTLDNDLTMVTMSRNSQQQKHIDESQIVENKLTDLVQQLGKQLENDAQKLNDKLEIRLKDLEKKIHQQTHIIRRQDEVIERLKSQIQHIETERDHFRQRLTVHERREQYEQRTSVIAQIPKQNSIRELRHPNTSAAIPENNRPSVKKTPAPRVDTQRSTTNNERESKVETFVKTFPPSRNRINSNSSSDSSVDGKLPSLPPIVEPSAASTRLDTIIHQPHNKETVIPSQSAYSIAQVRHQDRPTSSDRISIEQKIVTSVHQDESDDEGDANNNNNNNVLTKKRTDSSSSSSSSLPTQPVKTNNTATANRNPNRYPSFESLQHSHRNEQNRKLSTKTSSLQFGIKPVQDNEPGSIYVTSPELNRPANQLNSIVKGWLRKQNRESFLKRIERYFCVLRNNTFLMYRTEMDPIPSKAVNLKGAKVLYYDDTKFGPSLELSWSNQSNDPKHYHLYAPNPQEANHWLAGINSAIHNLDNKHNWQRYRMNT